MPAAIRRAIERLNTRPFPRLIAHFASGIFETGRDFGESDLNMGIGGLLAILALPGGFISIMLFDKYSSLLRWVRHHARQDLYTVSMPDKYFFLVFSMVVAGVIVALKWDRILPGRQDYDNLAALPLRARTLFLANTAAVLLLSAIFIIDINAAATLLYPMVVLAESGSLLEYIRFAGVHILSMALASAFSMFALLALMAALMSILPPRLFRRVSMAVRLAAILALILMLCTSFTVPPAIQKLPSNPGSAIRLLPPVWFLAIYQRMQGHAGPALSELADRGLISTAAALALTLLFSAISYRRHFLRILESPSTPARAGGAANFIRFLDGWLLRTPVERACYRFAMRVLLRSETHSILFCAFAGFGLVIASQSAIGAFSAHEALPAPESLAIPLTLAFFVIAGLRVAFDVPAALSGNWILRLLVDDRSREAAPLARRIVLSFLIPLVVTPTVAIYAWRYGAYIGIAHSAFVLSMCVLLM